MKKKKASPANKGPLIIKNDGAFVFIEKQFLNDLSFNEALGIGVATLYELRRTLVDEALMDKDLYVGNQKLADGLNNTINYLWRSHPKALEMAGSVEINSSFKTFKC